jgi:hypothetical protein
MNLLPPIVSVLSVFDGVACLDLTEDLAGIPHLDKDKR